MARSLTPQLGQAYIAFLWKRGKHMTVSLQTLMHLIRVATKSVKDESENDSA